MVKPQEMLLVQYSVQCCAVLQQAKLLLETSTFNISEIAYQVGFNDPAYFARAFKKQYGKTPTNFMQDGK